MDWGKKTDLTKAKILKAAVLGFVIGCAVFIIVLYLNERIVFPLFSEGTESYEFRRLPYVLIKCAVCGVIGGGLSAAGFALLRKRI